jgi:hypothetical protein
LQAGTDGLCDTGAAGPLRLVKKLSRNLNGDLARSFHDPMLYHIKDQHRIWYRSRRPSRKAQRSSGLNVEDLQHHFGVRLGFARNSSENRIPG